MSSVNRALGLVLLATTLGLPSGNAQAGGGSSGVHYLCGSRSLRVSFQLDNRPDARHFPIGTKVLVTDARFNPTLFSVSGFRETDETVTLSMGTPFSKHEPRDMVVTWLGNSILNNIRIKYFSGSRVNTALDGRCTVLN